MVGVTEGPSDPLGQMRGRGEKTGVGRGYGCTCMPAGSASWPQRADKRRMAGDGAERRGPASCDNPPSKIPYNRLKPVHFGR
jgi:hypothetical protein